VKVPQIKGRQAASRKRTLAWGWREERRPGKRSPGWWPWRKRMARRPCGMARAATTERKPGTVMTRLPS
jgi:hypothetical protein